MVCIAFRPPADQAVSEAVAPVPVRADEIVK